MVTYAVSSFPKQSLNEWVLDYPQQIVLTTLHLILTHEINEVLENYENEKDEYDDAILDLNNNFKNASISGS